MPISLASRPRVTEREASVDQPRPASLGKRSTLLGILLSRALTKTFVLAERLGRLTLFIGLTLVALTALRLPGGVGSWADPFLAISLLCAFWLSWRRGVRVKVFAIHALGLLLLMSGAAIATMHSANAVPTLIALAKFLFATTLMFLTCALLIDRRELIVTAVGCWVVSVVVTSGAAVLQAWFGETLPGYEGAAWGRLAGLTNNPNGLGAVAGMAMAPALSLAARTERLAFRTAWLAAAMVCAASIALSASRTGAVAAAVCLALWALLHYRLNREFTFMVIGCCLAAAAAAGFLYEGGPHLTERLSVAATDPESDGAIRSRLEQYDFVLRNTSTQLFVGVGLSPGEATAYGEGVHNTFLLVLRGAGILGFLGIVAIVGDLLRKGLQSYSSAQSYESKVLALGFFTAIVGLVLAGMAGPILYQREVWVPVGLLFAFQTIAQHRRRSPQRSRSRRRRQGGPEVSR